jgi:uncharacterized membrane protein
MKIIIASLFLTSLFFQVKAQEVEYNSKFNLTISTVDRDAEATLFIKDSTGNTFTGTLIIDNDERPVFGWYTENISEGGIYHYNTVGIVFYVDLKIDFQHQQLFKGLFNFDKTTISGTYFYWGNEFIFSGKKVVQQSSIDSNLIREEFE